ncbi:MAG: PHP domain-containing protein [Caldisericota bacterium]|jgi:predicted metal-dependent phosphoesterase TrpH|nr:PHP domain-containing protein [Caldisericota bacterium]
MKADLHTHSTASDGSLSPSELIEEAKREGVVALALTDHDTLSGIGEAGEKAKEVGMEFIPGIEFSTEVGKSEIHILGYGLKNSNQIGGLLSRLKDSRMDRLLLMLKKLKNLGISLELDQIIKEGKEGVYGRPQVALALLHGGFVASVEEAFDRYLGMGRPAYVPHFKISPWEAISIIREAGGIPVYAHPGVSGRDDLITSFVKAGLLGLEVFYPEHNPQLIQHYLKICQGFRLLATGGSDFHGEVRPWVKLGDPGLPEKYYWEFKAFLSSK